MSPNSKKIKQSQDLFAQDAAFNELMLLKGANGGTNSHGDIKLIANINKEREQNIERHQLEYQMELQSKRQKLDNILPSICTVSLNNVTVISDMTGDVSTISSTNYTVLVVNKGVATD
jgi:hypothetical protein